MTCIVGLIDNDKVWIGGDSAGVSGWELTIRSDEKVFRNRRFLIGYTSSFRMGQLLRYKFKPSDPEDGADLLEYMSTVFVDEVRQCLKDGGFARREQEEEKGGAFLVGYKNKLFTIEPDYQVAVAADGYDAVGVGAQVALGSLYESAGKWPPSRILGALEAAEHFCIGVRQPFLIFSGDVGFRFNQGKITQLYGIPDSAITA